MVAAQIEQDWIRSIWTAFVEEQLELHSEKPMLRTKLNKSAPFFLHLDKVFRAESEVSSRSLCDAMDSRYLRTHLLASRFLVSHLSLGDFEKAREDITEFRRAEAIVSRSVGKPWHTLLSEYLSALREERVAVRTIRLYLRAAEVFCVNAGLSDSAPWREEALVSHLQFSPGSANSLSKFLSHCRRRFGWDVQMPKRSTGLASSVAIKMSIKDIRRLLGSEGELTADQMSFRHLTRLLSSALGVPSAQMMKARTRTSLSRSEGAVQVTSDGLIEPGHPLYPFARRWADFELPP